MILVIQCAATKNPGAGCLRTKDGRPVSFVADPAAAPADDSFYARPDDPSDIGPTWRDILLAYNRNPGNNPLNLARAGELYRHPVYGRLASAVGTANLYILSAGWGLIPADFLTPVYDITFSAQAQPYKRRKRTQGYADFCLLPAETTTPVVMFGGKEYAPFFANLTAHIRAPKTVFYNAAATPKLPGCHAVPFSTSRRTNWHYGCAEAFLDGSLDAVTAPAG